MSAADVKLAMSGAWEDAAQTRPGQSVRVRDTWRRILTWHPIGDNVAPMPPKNRHRLFADVPETTEAQVRQTARTFYRGVVSDAVTTALETFEWVIDARRRGKRVIATDADMLPDTFEEPVIAGLERLGHEWIWLVQRDHPWRRQLWIKGRSIAAGELARTAVIEGWTAEETAREFDLPVDAVLEAQRYAEIARDLIAAEEAEDRIVAQRFQPDLAPLR